MELTIVNKHYEVIADIKINENEDVSVILHKDYELIKNGIYQNQTETTRDRVEPELRKKIMEAGVTRAGAVNFLESKRKKALQEIVEIFLQMKVLDYSKDKKEYAELIEKCHDAFAIHDTILRENY